MKKTNEEIKVEVVSEAYNLSLGKYSILVTKTKDGLTIKTRHYEESFKFNDSSPETVEAIGKLLQAASKINLVI